MATTIVAWIMMLNLVVTFFLLNIYENKMMNKPDRRFEPERRHFSYDDHIPERRAGEDRRWLRPDRNPQDKYKILNQNKKKNML